MNAVSSTSTGKFGLSCKANKYIDTGTVDLGLLPTHKYPLIDGESPPSKSINGNGEGKRQSKKGTGSVVVLCHLNRKEIAYAAVARL